MNRHALKSFGLSALFLAGLLSMLPMTACVASSEESACWLEHGEESEGACDEEIEGEGPDEEATPEEATPSGRAVSPKPPVSTPQALCSPICDRI
jgi:hypothetical protein